MDEYEKKFLRPLKWQLCKTGKSIYGEKKQPAITFFNWNQWVSLPLTQLNLRK